MVSGEAEEEEEEKEMGRQEKQVSLVQLYENIL